MNRLRRDETGNAMIEFTFLGVLLFVPLVYLVIAVLDVQRTAYGTSTAVREAGRAYVTATTAAEAEQRAEAAARIALADQGIELAPGELQITCSADPCLTPGAVVTVRISTEVALPWVPVLGDRPAAAVSVGARHDAVVDAFRPTGRSTPMSAAGAGLVRAGRRTGQLGAAAGLRGARRAAGGGRHRCLGALPDPALARRRGRRRRARGRAAARPRGALHRPAGRGDPARPRGRPRRRTDLRGDRRPRRPLRRLRGGGRADRGRVGDGHPASHPAAPVPRLPRGRRPATGS